jgi:hypothetical protein
MRDRPQDTRTQLAGESSSGVQSEPASEPVPLIEGPQSEPALPEDQHQPEQQPPPQPPCRRRLTAMTFASLDCGESLYGSSVVLGHDDCCLTFSDVPAISDAQQKLIGDFLVADSLAGGEAARAWPPLLQHAFSANEATDLGHMLRLLVARTQRNRRILARAVQRLAVIPRTRSFCVGVFSIHTACCIPASEPLRAEGVTCISGRLLRDCYPGHSGCWLLSRGKGCIVKCIALVLSSKQIASCC